MTLYISRDNTFPNELSTTLKILQLSSVHIKKDITFPLSLEKLIIEKPLFKYDNFQDDVDNLCSTLPYGCEICFSDYEKRQFDKYCQFNIILIVLILLLCIVSIFYCFGYDVYVQNMKYLLSSLYGIIIFLLFRCAIHDVQPCDCYKNSMKLSKVLIIYMMIFTPIIQYKIFFQKNEI